MSRELAQAAFDKALREKEALNAIVSPLREARDKVIADMHPLEVRASELAERIKSHMPAMAEIDKRLAAAARELGHPSVGGVPQAFGR